ncbi:hypothetical protein [Herpetosiphon gulosus]|uniref:Uncharacterized protein n=1 Tax=Herpetosiphon gulosus TaxID=1973496 RepID=A0ABP9WYN0_9CHLR
MQRKQLFWHWAGAGLAGVLLLVGCGRLQKTSYAAGQSLAAITPTSGYNFLAWDAGMRVLIVYDGIYEKEDCESSMEINSSKAINRCRIVFDDGTIVVWQITALDNQPIELIINETNYPLPEADNLVIIHTQNGAIQVEQQQRKLGEINFTAKAIDAWIKADPLTAPIVFPEN